MALEIDDKLQEFIRHHRVARLATAGLDGQPQVVPICYAFDGSTIYSPLDEKPKGVEAKRLKRVRNIAANPQVALVIDDYSEDWGKLQFVLLSGRAEIIEPGATEHARAVALLRAKYPQYQAMALDQRPVIKITPARIKRWDATQQPS